MAGLADLTFFSELSYPTIIASGTTTISTLTKIASNIPLDSRVMVWKLVDGGYIIMGNGLLENDSVYLKPDGTLWLGGTGTFSWRVYGR